MASDTPINPPVPESEQPELESPTREPVTIASTLDDAQERGTAEELDLTLDIDELPESLLIALSSLHDKQAQDLKVFKTADLTPFYSYAVVVSGLSGVQRDVLARMVREDLHKLRVNPLSVEGNGDSGWILMDYQAFLIHIQSPEKRKFYNLESMWGDLPSAGPTEDEVNALLEVSDAE